MADIKVCDLCSKRIFDSDWYFKVEAGQSHKLSKGIYSYYDICSDCFTKIKDFVERTKDAGTS